MMEETMWEWCQLCNKKAQHRIKAELGYFNLCEQCIEKRGIKNDAGKKEKDNLNLTVQ